MKLNKDWIFLSIDNLTQKFIYIFQFINYRPKINVVITEGWGDIIQENIPLSKKVSFVKKENLLLLLNLSRWREAVCIMMLVSDPHITNDGVNKLGRQLAQLFRQDLQV